MSLSDTAFIFVLALIIFGPKKLPEIGRQLGRLVGEFRRASNEFKFQIEEELRQVDRDEQRPDDRNKDQPRIDPPKQAVSSPSTSPTASPDLPDAEQNLPVGQHPNIESLNLSALDNPSLESAEVEPAQEKNGEDSAEFFAPASLPTITAAVGSQARATSPFVNVEPSPVRPASIEPSAANGKLERISAPTSTIPESTDAVSATRQGPAPRYPAPAEADLTHG